MDATDEIIQAARFVARDNAAPPHLKSPAQPLINLAHLPGCPACGVPRAATIAQHRLDQNGEEMEAIEVRLACGERVGYSGMERWLECGDCADLDDAK